MDVPNKTPNHWYTFMAWLNMNTDNRMVKSFLVMLIVIHTVCVSISVYVYDFPYIGGHFQQCRTDGTHHFQIIYYYDYYNNNNFKRLLGPSQGYQ